MKYIFLNDIIYLLRQKRKYFISYFIIVFLYFVFNSIIGNVTDKTIFYNSLAISCDFSNSGWLEMLIFVFSIAIYIYI